jgi:hypothetical protein
MAVPIEIVESITKLIDHLDYLELTVLENAINSKRYLMKMEESKKFACIEKVGA